MVFGLFRKFEVKNWISVFWIVELIVLIVIEGIRNYVLEFLCIYFIRGLGICYVYVILYMLYYWYWIVKNMVMGVCYELFVYFFYFMINYLNYIFVYFL